MTGADLGQIGEGEPGGALFSGEVAEAQRPAQPGVALRAVGEDEQVLAVRVGLGHRRGPPPPDLLDRLRLAPGDPR